MIEFSLFDSYWSKAALLFVSSITFLYLYSLHRFNYWKKKRIPYIPGIFPFGSIKKLVLQKVGTVEQFRDFYDQVQGKYAGFYAFYNPQLIVKDLDLIKDVLVKNFSDFTNRGIYVNETIDPLSAHLFAIEGNQWKNLRSKLSPTFTSGKMKTMYGTLKESAIDLKNYTGELIKQDDIVDFKDVTSRFGLDVISNTALGLKGNNFVENNSDMKRIAQLIVAPTAAQMFRVTFALMCKTIAKLIRMRFVPKEVEDYFLRIIEDNTEYREKNEIKRNDFMQLLIDMKNNKIVVENANEGNKVDNKVSLTIKEMAAQSFVFVAAGFETSSVTLGFCLYELALNRRIQDKLVAELDAAGEDISYEDLNRLSYLDMVVNETLRKYPPVPFLQRECSRDYVLPGGQVVDKGTLFLIPVIGLHLDPKLFPNPETFDPERFNKENVCGIAPYSYLPFGEGPRVCIGARFGKIQVKVALVALLSHFTVEICDKTNVPIKIEKRTFTYNVEGGVWLQVKERR